MSLMIVGMAAATVSAQQPASEKQTSTYDRIWKFTEWYENDSNPVVQSVLFSGRYQYEFAAHRC